MTFALPIPPRTGIKPQAPTATQKAGSRAGSALTRASHCMGSIGLQKRHADIAGCCVAVQWPFKSPGRRASARGGTAGQVQRLSGAWQGCCAAARVRMGINMEPAQASALPHQQPRRARADHLRAPGPSGCPAPSGAQAAAAAAARSSSHLAAGSCGGAQRAPVGRLAQLLHTSSEGGRGGQSAAPWLCRSGATPPSALDPSLHATPAPPGVNQTLCSPPPPRRAPPWMLCSSPVQCPAWGST